MAALRPHPELPAGSAQAGSATGIDSMPNVGLLPCLHFRQLLASRRASAAGGRSGGAVGNGLGAQLLLDLPDAPLLAVEDASGQRGLQERARKGYVMLCYDATSTTWGAVSAFRWPRMSASDRHLLRFSFTLR